MKIKAEITVVQPQAKEFQWPLEVGGARKDSPLGPLKRVQSYQNLELKHLASRAVSE